MLVSGMVRVILGRSIEGRLILVVDGAGVVVQIRARSGDPAGLGKMFTFCRVFWGTTAVWRALSCSKIPVATGSTHSETLF